MRIPPKRIEELQTILKRHYNIDFDNEQAQEAGRAILKFVGLKFYQQLHRDKLQNGNGNGRQKRSTKKD